MTLELSVELDDEREYDKYTLATGCCVMLLGIVGLFLNVSTLMFFLKYDHQGVKHRKRFKAVLVNLSLVDILLSLAAATIRGPGFIWPTVIYGEATFSSSGTPRCTIFSALSTWLLSDLNTCAIIPISCIRVFLPSARQMSGILAAVWLLPLLELIMLIVGIEQGHLNSYYTESYYKCTIHLAEGSRLNWENLVDYFNMIVFNILPLVVHICIWVSLCCKESRLSRAKFLSGALVVLTALVTWLPYAVVHGILRYDTDGGKSLVYIFFYLSVVTNPVIYGFMMYKWDIFREGCSKCCVDEGAESEPSQPTPEKHVALEQKSFTDIESASATMVSDEKLRV